MSTNVISELDLYNDSIKENANVAAAVANLRDVLGDKLVAYLGSVRETRAVRQWAENEREPSSDDVIERLRFANQVVTLMYRKESRSLIQSWFQGLNPLLDDHSPATLIRSGDISEVGPRIIAAARAFLATW